MLFKRIPKGLWRRMRDLWAVTYGMGAGSMHVRAIRDPGRAAAYVTKVASYMCKVDDDGRKIGRGGQPYETEWFTGNAYGVSDALRCFSRPTAEYHVSWGHPLAYRLADIFGKELHLTGFVYFAKSKEHALSMLGALLDTS
jgi:hypothetical protein